MATKAINKSLSKLKLGVKLILKKDNELVYFLRLANKSDSKILVTDISGLGPVKTIRFDDVESFQF